MKAVNHLQLSTQVFLCEVFKHSSVDETFHEETSILRQTKTRQPLIANPLVIHLTES